MSAIAPAMLGSVKIANKAVSASYTCVLDADNERHIAERAVALVLEDRHGVSPIRLVSRDGSTAAPQGRYISLDLEDFQ